MSTAIEEDTAALRHTLHDFLTANDLGKPPKDKAGRLAWRRRWCALLADHGLAAPSWPKQWGGMELSFPEQVVYAEEMERARVPSHPGTGVMIAAPTLITHGTQAQKERWLRPLLRADEIWAQGWSEPEAGSDLPALRTKAVRRGDVYIVNGQKTWSSAADVADRIFALVRTGPRASGREGISYLIIDARAPGVTVREIRDMTGGSDFCEIFFDDVEVPVTELVGVENGGWGIARTSMGHERAAGGLIAAGRYRRIVTELVELARERGVLSDPAIRGRLAEVESAARIMVANAARTIDHIQAHGEPGPASSIGRLFNSTFEQRLHELAIEILGLDGVLDPSDSHAVQRGRWVWGFLRTRASTIGAGTAEIQRNTIAERVLGMPREELG